MNNSINPGQNSPINLPDDEELSRILRSEGEKMLPPPEVRESLINSVRMYNNANVPASSIGTATSAIIRKVGIPIAAGIALYFSALYVNGLRVNNSDNKLPQQSIAQSKAPADEQSQAPLVSSKEETVERETTISTSVNSRNNKKQIFSKQNTVINSDLNSEAATNSPEVTIVEANSTAIESKRAYYNLNHSYRYSNSTSPYLESGSSSFGINKYFTGDILGYSQSFDNSPLNYIFTLRGMAGSTFADNYNIASSIKNSFAVGFYKSMSDIDGLYVGIEFGTEPLQKKYFNKYEPELLEYVDNPNTIWGAVGIKYEISNWDIAGIQITPYSGFLLGAGEIGPMGRLNLGVDQKLSSNISISLGAEFTTMLYNNKVRWYSSNKLGLTAGINYKL